VNNHYLTQSSGWTEQPGQISGSQMRSAMRKEADPRCTDTTACVAGEATTRRWSTACLAWSTLVLQWLYTSAVEDWYLFLEEWPPRGSIGREDLNTK